MTCGIYTPVICSFQRPPPCRQTQGILTFDSFPCQSPQPHFRVPMNKTRKPGKPGDLHFVCPGQGFIQDFEIGCPKWYFYPFLVIIKCPVSIYSMVNFEILGSPKSEQGVYLKFWSRSQFVGKPGQNKTFCRKHG